MCILRLASLATLSACTVHVPGLREHVLDVEGARRTYDLYVPAALRSPAPVVVALHRFIENGALMAKLTGFNDVADREGFVVVYPNGPGRRFEAFDDAKRDDVDFVLTVLDDVARRVEIDRARVYVTGASNGGFLTHRLAALAPDVFAAAAPVMALMPRQLAERVPDGKPVPMLMIHGSKDRIVKESATRVWGGKKYGVLPMDQTVEYWVRRNRSRAPRVTEVFPDHVPDDGTVSVLYRYPAGDAETQYCRVQGGGHTWPGGDERAPAFIVGKTARDLSASELIWSFFERHEHRARAPRVNAGARRSTSTGRSRVR